MTGIVMVTDTPCYLEILHDKFKQALMEEKLGQNTVYLFKYYALYKMLPRL